MPRSYDRHEFNDDAGDYKRKRRAEDGSGGGLGDHHSQVSHQQPHESTQLNEKTNEYLQDCLTEKKSVEKKYPVCKKLIETGNKSIYKKSILNIVV